MTPSLMVQYVAQQQEALGSDGKVYIYESPDNDTIMQVTNSDSETTAGLGSYMEIHSVPSPRVQSLPVDLDFAPSDAHQRLLEFLKKVPDCKIKSYCQDRVFVISTEKALRDSEWPLNASAAPFKGLSKREFFHEIYDHFYFNTDYSNMPPSAGYDIGESLGAPLALQEDEMTIRDVLARLTLEAAEKSHHHFFKILSGGRRNAKGEFIPPQEGQPVWGITKFGYLRPQSLERRLVVQDKP